MPKIPTFTSQARMTAETGQQAPVIQQDLSKTMASAFAPAIKTISDFAVKEKKIQDKAEALDLENQSIIELNTATQKASKLLNKEEAFTFLRSESARIKETFGAKASSSSVRNIFNNNYLLEEQKGIYKTDNAVYKNIVQHSNNQKEIKQERLIKDALFGENQLSRETLYNSLIQLENDDLVQDADTRAKNIALIPRKIDFFTAKQAINEDPVEALRQFKDTKNNYVNLDADTLGTLIRDAKIKAAPEVRDNVSNYLAAKEVGKDLNINEESIQDVLGDDAFKQFKETQSGLQKISELNKELFTSKKGEESAIVDKFVLRPENYAEDLKLRQKLIFNLEKKQQLIKEDPASLIMGYNPNVKQKYNEYNEEQDPALKSEKHKIFISSVYEAQKEMGLSSDQIKVIPAAGSKEMVNKYNDLDVNGKIGFLKVLENDYGDLYGKAILQLSGDKLPITAELGSYFGDKLLATEMISIDTKEERKRLDSFISKTGDISVTKKTIQKAVMDDLEDFRKTVMTGNPFDTSIANKKLENMEEVLTYLAINKMSTGAASMNEAVSSATKHIKENFLLKETYHIPRIVGDKKLDPVVQEFIADKAEIIQSDYLELFNPKSFKSANKAISADEKLIDEKMMEQMKSKGVWLNTADGEGLVFAVKFKNGSFGLVENEDGELLRFDFTDTTYRLPGTGINGKKEILIDLESKQSIIDQQNTGA